MIDLAELKTLAAGGDAGDVVQADFTKRHLRRVIAELEAGRAAAKQLAGSGRVFGLKPGDRL